MELLNLLQQFHLIRPYWLLAIFPAAIFIWLYARTQLQSRNWASVIDKRLLPHLLKGTTSSVNNKKPVSVALLAILSLLIIIALAGPAYEKRPQPVFKAQSALVLILDLSRSMDAGDIKPSRLSRAHFKINDILKQRKEGQTALIVYAADAFTVSPLTDDADTIAAQVPALDTSIMPAQGSRLDKALEKAAELFTNAGHSKGDIIIISDSTDNRAINKARKLKDMGYTSSVLAIGTADGAPINANGGGFVKDKSGAIVVPKLDLSSMRKLALSGGGLFSQFSAGDNDINTLLKKVDIDKSSKGDEQLDAEGNKFKTDLWHEEGPWLILLVIPFAAYAFRKGLVFLLLVFIIPLPQPAQALEWKELWNNKDQLGQAELQQGNAEAAANLFKNPEWKAAAAYKAGDYEQTINQLNDIDTADANYNRGNALAKAGKLDEAIEAYKRATELQPDHEDARHNQQIVEQAKQQNQQQNNQQGDSEKSEKQDSDQSDSQQSDHQNNEQQQQDSSQNSEEQSDAQQSESQNNENNNDDSDKQSGEEQQAAEQKEATEQQDEEPDLDQQQTQQWLKKIPDDPGGLLRRKFQYQYGREKRQNEQQPW